MEAKLLYILLKNNGVSSHFTAFHLVSLSFKKLVIYNNFPIFVTTVTVTAVTKIKEYEILQ